MSDSSPLAGVRSRRQFVTALGATGLTLLGGCAAPTDSETLPPEATVTVRIRNRDDVPRQYAVVVRQGGQTRNEFSGELPADQEQFVEMVATFRPTAEQHEVTINTDAGQVGRTWDPTECSSLVVDAYVEDGRPGFDARCDSGE